VSLAAIMVFATARSSLASMFHFLQPLVDGLRWMLSQLHGLGLSWGLSIVALTVIVRIPLIWPSLKQYRSMMAMASLQPLIKELQKKHKGDKQRLQQEQMRLFSENQVHPLGSCLPIVPQAVVMSLLFYSIRGAHDLAGAGFLWIDALGKPDPHYILLAIYVVSQLVSSLIMMTPQTDKNQKVMMLAMPLVFVFILKGFPAGLFVYWITSNLLVVLQMQIFKRVIPVATAVPLTDSRAKEPAQGAKASAKKPGFMERVLAAQEEREARMRGKTGKGKPGARPGGKQSGKPGGKTGGTPGGRPGGKPRGGKSGGSKPPDALR